MTLISLTDGCRLLAIDSKTLRRWLAQAQLPLQPHPGDARLKGMTADQLRLLATAHHRSLPALPEELAAPAPTGHPPEPSPLPPELLDLLQPLRALPAQIAALQQQVADLTRLLRQHEHLSATPVVPTPPPRASSRPPKPASKPLHKSAHVIPRVEHSGEGHYVVICPQRGVLPFEPDSPDWFAWLDIVSSFRFVGKAGHFTAHHESLRVPHGAWRAHRNIRNHTCILRLAPSHDLTIAVLEHTAAALQAHLS